jgi:hypothetical protein
MTPVNEWLELDVLLEDCFLGKLFGGTGMGEIGECRVIVIDSSCWGRKGVILDRGQ